MGELNRYGRPVTQDATLTNVTASATSVQLLAANHPGRMGVTIFNDGTTAMDVKYGITASATSFTVEIASGGYWEMPEPIYTGRIDGIWDGAPTGAARITEMI